MPDLAGEDGPQAGCDAHLDVKSQDRDIGIVTRGSRVDSLGKADEEPTRIAVTTAFPNPSSNPVSPGPSSPPLEQARDPDFVPPARPSSTPFLYPEHRDATCCRPLSSDDDEPATAQQDDETAVPSPADPSQKNGSLNNLPPEIVEVILDHLFGYRVSANSKSSLHMHSVTKSWNTALRHARRKEVSSLALVSPSWRVLVQQRLFRHLKLRATTDYLGMAALFLTNRPYLRSYVKHVELWFPVFQPRHGPLTSNGPIHLPFPFPPPRNNNQGATETYLRTTANCTLEEALIFVLSVLPSAIVLTLEGGERKKAPKVVHTSWAKPDESYLPVLPGVRTLVTKGQWNLLRTDEDFKAILSSLPNLAEWHGSYSKPKSKSYLSMYRALPMLPAHLTSLHLNLESDYRRELSCPAFFMKVSSKIHFCLGLAEATLPLERLSYTGRVCKVFFLALAARSDPRMSKIKSIDITVKNCCRNSHQYHDSGSGIQDMQFISSFELLVVAAIRALSKLPRLEYLRIRFIDLDSPVPPLNPYFLLRGNTCWGVWSDFILTELHKARPTAQFEELSDSFGEIGYNKEGRLVISTAPTSKSQFRSLKLANYALLSGSIAGAS
ncbi:hypothetical protein SODALDRAFT_274751 [Sodiomyces alkalinus F11]|uniref:Uncharacterized protein n=1 Tax=Sodiomyces alkalinus (strain CBS 110278 / VKM F-3762 / F11) TaxID=1314773 RepID=A0A3N2Q040_SODAK|nr:hypothetical protein SODALDRAFT_274751 [Sodiomyces alkalinus F11]ROT39975.1 hypothetical protein SODALDRAFT_274751 [Sodiomyces alkalinus F11]